MSTVTQENVSVPSVIISDMFLPWADLTSGASGSQIMTSQELLLISGLDWDVAVRPLYRRMNDTSIVEHPRAKEVYRTDTEVSLGVVRGHYHPWPNREAFAPWDAMVKSGEGTWQEAGAQRNGARVFMTMKLNQVIAAMGDIYDYYLFIGVGHDGYVAINPSVIPIRQSNLTHSAIGENSIRVQHTPSLETKKAEVHQVQELVSRYKDIFTRKTIKLAESRIDDKRATSLLDGVMNPKRTRRGDLVTQIMEIYTASPQTHYGTTLGVFNALTYWQCHVRKHRQGNARFDSLMWGEDAKARNKLALTV